MTPAQWGSILTIQDSVLGESASVGSIHPGPLRAAGKNLSYQEHRFRSEIWTVIRGEGEFALDGVIRPIRAGDMLEIPAGIRHGIKALTDLEFIELQAGSQLDEEDF